MNITTLKDFFIDAYKKTVPSIIDYSGVYDSVINDKSHKLIVPMYHRVVDSLKDDPLNMGMCVSKEKFEEQLKYFSENYTPVLLRDYVADSNYRNNSSNYISLTFDDGYKEISTIAKDYMDRYKSKATIFICGHIFNEDNDFWWDVLIHSFSQTTKSTLDISELKLDLPYQVIQLDRATKRPRLIELVRYLWNVNDIHQVNDVANYIQNQLVGSGTKIPKLSEQDIINLHNSGYEIAAHTMTHPNLTLQSHKQKIKELSESKKLLEEIINDKIYGFAYPAGIKDNATEEIVKQCGFDYAVSTENGVNRKLNNYSIERVGMPETTIPDIKRCIYNYCKLPKSL